MVTAARLGPGDTAFTARSLHGLLSNAFLFAFQIWDYFVTVAGAHAYGYFTRVREQELERAELQQALAASELQAVKSQLHRHFLFNTLQGISALTDTDNRRAKAMPTQLRMRTSKTSPSRRDEISTR
jgi:sensor histidine kinase YesM